jgi:hypothetical protein
LQLADVDGAVRVAMFGSRIAVRFDPGNAAQDQRVDALIGGRRCRIEL